MTRLLLVQGTSQRYGSDRSSFELARGLKARGYDVTVALSEEGPLADDLRAEGIAIAHAQPGTPRLVYGKLGWLIYATWLLPRSVFQVRRLARRADIVHLNTSSMIGALVGARIAGRPLVVHVREWWVHSPRAWNRYGRLIARCATAIVANSADVAGQFDGLHGAEKISVVHNGLTFRPARPRHPERGSVTMTGRINEWKGQDVLVEAVRVLRERGVDVRATIAGDVFPGGDAHLERVKKAIADAGVADNVELAGFVEDVDALFARSEVFVLPSIRPEPFGLALIEAMAQATPCIATAGGGPSEIIDDGRTGILVPRNDAVALADAIERLLDDPAFAQRLGVAAAADVRERFAIEGTIDGVVAVYERVLA